MHPLSTRISQAGYKLILGSRSPRRRQLLDAAGFEFEVLTPGDGAERDPNEDVSPEVLVSQLAYRKAADVAARAKDSLVIGCDTVAECDGQILGKPLDESHARRMLETLSGRKHRVLSGLCLWPVGDDYTKAEPLRRVNVTSLEMDRLTPAQLDEYIAGGKWRGKAGSFGYQDELGWIHIVEGSESNVVGLPMELLEEMLAEILEGRRQKAEGRI